MSILTYLQKKEWSMGNGQCPECCGVSEEWLGHPLHLNGDGLGHEKGCELAKTIVEAGGTPFMIGDCESTLEYEAYIHESGALSTREKTKDGCPKLDSINKKIRDVIIYNKNLALNGLSSDT